MEDNELLRKTSILYVEDDALVRMSVAMFLQRRCKTVFEAGDGKKGLDLYMEHSPDVVITDVEMPVMDGLEMIDRIIAINAGQPIIITTGYNDDEHKSDKVCVNLIKPIATEELLAAVLCCARGTTPGRH